MTKPKGLVAVQRYKKNKWGSSGVQRCLKWCMGKQWQVEKSPRSTSGSHARWCWGGGVKEPPWLLATLGRMREMGGRGWKQGPQGDHGQTMRMLRKEMRSTLKYYLYCFVFFCFFTFCVIGFKFWFNCWIKIQSLNLLKQESTPKTNELHVDVEYYQSRRFPLYNILCVAINVARSAGDEDKKRQFSNPKEGRTTSEFKFAGLYSEKLECWFIDIYSGTLQPFDCI